MKILRITGDTGSGKSTLAIQQLSENRNNFLIIGEKSDTLKRLQTVPMYNLNSVAKCDDKLRIIDRQFHSLIVDEWERCLPNLLEVFKCDNEKNLIRKIEEIGTKRLVIIN